jgi:hypothetical protein
MSRWLLEEIRKAKRGEPSAVTLAPIPPEELAEEMAVQAILKGKGYRFAMGSGFKNRREMAESLPNVSKKIGDRTHED